MKIRAVVLDMDGLMLDTEPLYKVAWQQASRELGFELDDLAYSSLIGRQTADCEQELVRRFGAEFPLARFQTRWAELWDVTARERGISIKAGLLEFLSFVDDHGLPAAVATSSDADYTEFSLRCADLAGRFSVVVTGNQVARGKPAPDIYLEAARRLGIPPADCVALEDSDAGILAASAAGMMPLCIPDLKPPSAAAERAAFRVVPSLDAARALIAGLIEQRPQAG